LFVFFAVVIVQLHVKGPQFGGSLFRLCSQTE
jgi:hypothetical protein